MDCTHEWQAKTSAWNVGREQCLVFRLSPCSHQADNSWDHVPLLCMCVRKVLARPQVVRGVRLWELLLGSAGWRYCRVCHTVSHERRKEASVSAAMAARCSLRRGLVWCWAMLWLLSCCCRQGGPQATVSARERRHGSALCAARSNKLSQVSGSWSLLPASCSTPFLRSSEQWA